MNLPFSQVLRAHHPAGPCQYLKANAGSSLCVSTQLGSKHWKDQTRWVLDWWNFITKWVIISPERQHGALLRAETHLDKKGRILVLVQAECHIMVPFSIYSRLSHCKATATALCYDLCSHRNSLVLHPWLSILMSATTSESLVNKKASWSTSRVFWKYSFHCLRNYHQPT